MLRGREHHDTCLIMSHQPSVDDFENDIDDDFHENGNPLGHPGDHSEHEYAEEDEEPDYTSDEGYNEVNNIFDPNKEFLQQEWHQNALHVRERANARKKRRVAENESDNESDELFGGQAGSSHCNVESSGRSNRVEVPVSHDDGDEDMEGEPGSSSGAQARSRYTDAQKMDDWNSSHYGQGITPIIPQFPLSVSSSTWISFTEAVKLEPSFECRPVRALCFNVPASLFAFDGTRFRHWSTPESNPARASNIASVLSFCFTGTSKGFL